MLAVADLSQLLLGETIVALPDLHTGSKARRKAEQLLGSGGVNIFFMEFQRSAKTNNQALAEQYGISLNAAISEMIDVGGLNHEAAYDNLGSYFQGLSVSDAEPSLRSLTATAIENGVQVLASDADYPSLGLAEPSPCQSRGLASA